MKRVSVIIPCKNRLEHLKICLQYVLRQNYTDFEVIIVDYNCPEKSGDWAMHEFGIFPNLIVVNAEVDEHEWSLSAARNLGYKHSTGDILLFLDADALLHDEDFITKHVEHCVEGSFICGWGYHDATGCLMVHRSAFEAVKGYNEALKAWGYEDIDIYNRLQFDVANEKRNWLGGISTLKHGDELRNYYHGGKDPMQTNDENYQIAQHEFKGI